MGLTETLLIALAGMGLVFGAIALFWALIGVLVRVTGEDQGAGQPAAAPPAVEAVDGLKRPAAAAAAAAAVGVALAEREAAGEPGLFPLPPTALVSTWQAVMRAGQLAQRRIVR